MSNFRLVDRDTGFLLPPSVDEWLPERHLARFVVEVIEGLDLRAMIGSYRSGGEAAYHPRLLLGILVYGYQPVDKIGGCARHRKILGRKAPNGTICCIAHEAAAFCQRADSPGWCAPTVPSSRRSRRPHSPSPAPVPLTPEPTSTVR